MPKKKKTLNLLPRRGAPTNLRKAGAHDEKKRKKLDAVGEKEREDLVALGSWAFEEE